MTDNFNSGGKGRPPTASQFKPGQSGNPRGRPRGKRNSDPYDIILGRMVPVRQNGVERLIRADAAFLLWVAKQGLAGKNGMACTALDAVQRRPRAGKDSSVKKSVIMRVYPDPGDLRDVVRHLQIAKLLDPYRPSARLALETWAVEEALGRLGERQLTVEEQQVVVSATRMPHKVQWPAWWTVL